MLRDMKKVIISPKIPFICNPDVTIYMPRAQKFIKTAFKILQFQIFIVTLPSVFEHQFILNIN